MWPAVPTTTCRAALSVGGDTAERPRKGRDLRGEDRAAVEEQAIVSDAAERGRVAGAQRLVDRTRGDRRASDRDRRGGEDDRWQRAAADLRLVLHDPALEPAP